MFSFPGRMRPLNYLRAWLDVRKLLNGDRFDLIHIHYGQCGLACLPTNLPVVVTFHGSDLEGIIGNDGKYIWQSSILKRISRMIAFRADQIIVVSESLGNLLPSRCDYEVIPHGIDLDLFRIMTKTEARGILGLPEDKRLVLFAGSPDIPRERYYLAQKALRMVKLDDPADLLVVTGESHDKMPLYMNACDALLMTSIHESSPNMIKEALACNLPIVSVDVGDVKKRILGLPRCVVCENDLAETIAAGLKQVLGSLDLQETREAIYDLNEKLLVNKVIEVYEKATQP